MKPSLRKLVVAEALLVAFVAIVAAGNQATVSIFEPKAYRTHPGSSVLLNNKTLTPGAIRTNSPDDVCSTVSTRAYRKTTEAMKRSVYEAYGVDKTQPLPGDAVPLNAKAPWFEIDHLISLELGGADDVKNLWPQPYYEHPGAREKDAVENYLHAQVCKGNITLADAQKQIADDWYAIYLKMPKN